MDIAEIKKELELDYFLERESIPFKRSRGRSGMQLNVQRCPACDDDRYRVYLNEDTGVGNCFVCNEPFNKLTFIAHALDLGDNWRDIIATCKEILTEQGWRPPRTVTAAVEVPVNVKLPLSLQLPTKDDQNLAYLENRGINGDIAGYFHLRYCQAGWWNFTKEDGTTGGQDFGERVIIPVFDLDGELVTFQGRDITGTKNEQKYLFPKMLPGTGRYLLNGQNVQLTSRVAMGEGAFDIMAMKIAFDEAVDLRDVVSVASFGKHLSYGAVDGNDQLGCFLKLKARGVREVTIMWDGSTDALNSGLDAARLLVGIGLKVRIALLPKGRDPNEVPADVVRECFYKAQVYTPSLDVRLRLRSPYA
ncbi:hypothetical protein [Aureimonas sp. AU40]|uniref:hypothetical protein n=1 Tax=Aureimonas sp. AU40 TaxID=1637747 RepID=UPI000781E13F|nr:hypothetical protein [Aureimonas sp. AU40]